MSEDDTFFRVTNKDIYLKIEELIKNNSEEHKKIINHQIVTNGKVKLNKWIATTALTLIITIILYLVGAKL